MYKMHEKNSETSENSTTSREGGRWNMEDGKQFWQNGKESCSGTWRRFCLSATEDRAIQVLRHSWDSRSHYRKRTGRAEMKQPRKTTLLC